MHTEKKSELHRVVLRLAESGQFAQLTKYMLDIEARIQKLEAVAEAANEIVKTHYVDATCKNCTGEVNHVHQLMDRLAELEQQ